MSDINDIKRLAQAIAELDKILEEEECKITGKD